MPIRGDAKKVLKSMEETYGPEKAERIFYATANKQKRKPETWKKVATPKLAALKMTPKPHQEQVAEKLETEPGQIAFHGLGTGKTLTAINAAHRHNANLLAVVPASLRNNMKKEIEASGFKRPFRVMSYQEALKNLDNPQFHNFARNSITAFDEAHRAGRAESQRSKLPAMIPSKKKLFLTGTPIRNRPEEVAPLINALQPGALPDAPKDFRQKFTLTREVPVGFWGRLRGVKPGKETVPVNLHDFEKAVKGKVDFYENVDRGDFPSHSESIVETPMSDRQQAAYDYTLGKYPAIAYKIRHGLPLNKSEERNFKAFMTGPRQVVNYPGSFNRRATDADAVKIVKAVDEIQQRHKKDPNFRGVTYSSFLDTGVKPISRELERRGIPHAVFTGEQDDATRKKIIEDYNAGRTPVLLISGAGAEGLDLKGTRLMQILEPHWNEELINQVRGRAIRYKSHEHLPEKHRHVEVQRFHAIPRKTLIDRLFRRERSKAKSVDEFLYEMARKKRQLNEPFLNVLKGQSADQATKLPDENIEVKRSEVLSDVEDASFQTPQWAFWEVRYDQVWPAVLIDLDDTLVTTPGKVAPDARGEQQIMPGRIDVLRQLKDKGYRIIVVTNRSVYEEHQTVEGVIDCVIEAGQMLGELIDDIVFIPDGPSELHKPSPALINYAIARYRLDPENVVFVGDSDDDRRAAWAAKVPYYDPDSFFRKDFAGLPPAKVRPYAEPEQEPDPQSVVSSFAEPYAG